MTWLLGTMAGVLIWCAVLAGAGGCIRDSETGDDDREDQLATHQFEHDMAAGEDRDDD